VCKVSHYISRFHKAYVYQAYTTLIGLGLLVQHLNMQAKENNFKYVLIYLNHEIPLNTNSLAFMAYSDYRKLLP